MIVKDEEEWIESSLSSVLPIAQQIIVVDTGSTDKTIEIATSLGAEVHMYRWNEDFSAARNYSLSKATGDWILVLDADEIIHESDLQILQEQTNDPELCYTLVQRHYTNASHRLHFRRCIGEYPELEEGFAGYFESQVCRMFPRDERIRFVGRIHEMVERTIEHLEPFKLVASEVRLHHYGNTFAARTKRKKGEIYTSLLEKKVQEMPDDWRTLFELSCEYLGSGRLQDCEKTLRALLAIQPQYIEAWQCLGIALVSGQRYQEAIDAYNHALEIDPQSTPAHINLAAVYMQMKRPIFAEQHLLRAVELMPDNPQSQLRLAQCYVANGKIDEAIDTLQITLELLPDHYETWLHAGMLLLEAREYSIAAPVLAKAKLLAPQLLNPQFLYIQALLGSNQIAEAKEMIEAFRDTIGDTPIDEDVTAFLKEADRVVEGWHDS